MFSGSGLARRTVARRLIACAVLAGIGASLAGCVETLTEVDARAPAAPGRMAARQGVSPRAATVAFASFEGAPASVVPTFTRLLAAEAKTRDITVVDVASAKYFVRGYLGAYAAEGGATIGYVWDVFDAQKVRVQRLEDQIMVKGTAADPWSLADERVLTSLAAKSADDLAALLTNMPEAVASAGSVLAPAQTADAGGGLASDVSAFR
jgi:hypothetical protein